MTMSHYTGPGELLLAPSMLGDIMSIQMEEPDEWKIGRDAFLGHTAGVEHKYQSQGLSKGVFSGEGFFIYHITGSGILWIQSFGAIIQKDVSLSGPLIRERMDLSNTTLQSFAKMRHTSSTMGTSWLGTASTRLSVWPLVVSSPELVLARVLPVNSRAPELFIYRPGT